MFGMRKWYAPRRSTRRAVRMMRIDSAVRWTRRVTAGDGVGAGVRRGAGARAGAGVGRPGL